ncbi:MAG: hypothetical protein EAZ53_02920 [Bacteroidetes bacterium]|nr:MAG: hypothetical protein EAZ53_02920 [Bacteroidota bacterium]
MWQYQSERFPLLGHGILILSFTFSAMAYSHLCRQDHSPLDYYKLIIAFTNTFLLFLLLRISDEFKDRDFDLKNRPHLPVPRGLVLLSELKTIGIFVLIGLSSFNLIFAIKYFYLYFFILIYMALMFKEFFIKHWLEKNQLWYVTSHMLIIPLIDTLASSFDWMNNKPNMLGLFWFFAVSFFNGLTLELGRKIKVKEQEEANSYSLSLGFKKAMLLFQLVILITLLLCFAASYQSRLTFVHYLIFALLYSIAAAHGIYYYHYQTIKNAKLFEILSGLWAVGMYLNLGSSIFYK